MFAENLRNLRRSKNLSQEDFAELLDVSRQAVSRWEQSLGYPEVEKLLLMSEIFKVSLDELMNGEISEKATSTQYLINISSRYENVIMSVQKVMASKRFNLGKNGPKYALFGFNNLNNSFLGETTTVLGWYLSEDAITKEINSINEAIKSGINTYELKYNIKVNKHFYFLNVNDEE